MESLLFLLIVLALILFISTDVDADTEDDISDLDARSNWDASVEAWAVQ
jgi:hypothetical protein